jgi:glycosyltransferase involved in cell wall biosynthesis
MLICSNNYSIDKCYFGSRAAYDFSKEHYKMKDYELDLSPLGVDENKISISLSGVSRKKIRSELSIGDDKIVICTGGRLDSRKKVVELIKGFNKLDHNAILLIFGEVLSDIKEEFENLLQQSINVRYLGWLNDEKIYEVFYLSDLAIFPGSKSSLWEVATSISLPVFAQFWPGIDYIDFNGNIEFINVNSENDVYLILKKIVDDTSKLKRMRKVAKLNSMKNLSYKSIAMKIINDYKHLRLNL